MAYEADSQTYIEWKNWSASHQFGALGPGDAVFFASLMARVAPRPGELNVLEVGFGEGRFMAWCRSHGHKVTGNEINALLLDGARGAGYSVCSWDELRAYPSETFDVIAAFDVMEHIPVSDIAGWLSELRRLLKPDGRLVLRFPNGDSWQGLVNFNGDPTHVTPIGYFKLVFFAAAAGMTLIDYRGESRRGFETSMVHGLHRLVTAPMRFIIDKTMKILYFPGSPVVLGTANVIALLSPKADRQGPAE